MDNFHGTCVISMNSIVTFLEPNFRLLSSLFGYECDFEKNQQMLLVSFQVLDGQYLLNCGDMNFVI